MLRVPNYTTLRGVVVKGAQDLKSGKLTVNVAQAGAALDRCLPEGLREM